MCIRDSLSRVLVGMLKKVLNYNDIRFSETGLGVEEIRRLTEMLRDGRITERNAELVLREIVIKPEDPKKFAERKGMLLADLSEFRDVIDSVVEENKEAMNDYLSGKAEALNFLVGKVMQKTKGRVDPREIRKKLEEKLKSLKD